ncbi:MAG TPA: hypothetical protein VKU62_02855 [Thermoanaerobaculia bacterium]|nr:hypothetical protein [Thermoanaerobaculia bacterium]
MKKIALLLLSIALCAVSSGGDHPVSLNGKGLGTALTINGVVALPLEDVAKAAGLNLTTEPGLQLRGSTLTAKFIPGRLKWRPIVLKSAYAASIDINKEGVISNNVQMVNGKAYVPLADIVRAFGGGVWTPGNVAPGAAIQLNFARNPNAILIGL